VSRSNLGEVKASQKVPFRVVVSELFARYVSANDGRTRQHVGVGITTVHDTFLNGRASCCFIRIDLLAIPAIRFVLPNADSLLHCAAGGWLSQSRTSEQAFYWIPGVPKVRRVDEEGRILWEEDALIEEFQASGVGLDCLLEPTSAEFLDVVIWKFGLEQDGLQEELTQLLTIETQSFFLFASHENYCEPAQIYESLIHGHVYCRSAPWPRRWRFPDELDAYALYLILSGLQVATGKTLYSLLKMQVLRSVLDRQSDDGGWYHGEWTDDMECHVRLHCGGMHLLATVLDEGHDPGVADALERAARFLVGLTDQTRLGTWFLHDSLETSREGMNKGPFPWVSNRVLGKSETNMLVLNTHLDSLIALDRYQQVTGDKQFAAAIKSGGLAAHGILSLRPAEAFYRRFYNLVDLTLLPTSKAESLPFYIRALKRITWKYLIPRVHYLRSRWPRLVMPNGYVERAVGLRGVSHAYQSVNVWDLIRYRRRFSKSEVGGVIERALQYTQKTDLREFWVEKPDKSHALGFWADALWHLCRYSPEEEYRVWLAEAMILCFDAGIGVSPSLIGTNTECIPAKERVPCPSPADGNLLVANLSGKDNVELVVVNPTQGPLVLEWEQISPHDLIWVASNGKKEGAPAVVPGRGWVWGTSGATEHHQA